MSLYEKLKLAIAEEDDSGKTLDSYWHQCRKFYAFCRKPASQWCGPDVQRWLHHLHAQQYSRSSRKSALCAMAFVFRHILKADMGTLDLPPMPKERHALKVIPTREELARIFAGLKGQPKTMGLVIYGGGPRIEECCTLRVKDLDFATLSVRIHDGKGGKSRLTLLPTLLVERLQKHVAWRKALHDLDLANGGGLVELPGRLAVKYKNAPREFRWQWLFPSAVVRGQYRWHATDEMVAKQMRAAVKAAGIVKRITPHTLRHAFATHAMRAGNDIKTVQELLGHEDLNTTAIYLHADAARGISPLDVPQVQPLNSLPPAQLYQLTP